MMRRTGWLGAMFAVLAVAPSVALAHPLLDAAQAAAEHGDHAAAIKALTDAEALSEGLTRADVVTLYALRASEQHALGEGAARDEDLLRLAALDPVHAFVAPAELAAAWGAAKTRAPAQLRVETHTNPLPQGYQIQVRLVGDAPKLVRAVRVLSRREGERAWMTTTDTTANVATVSSLQYYVEVVGAGGAVIANEGTEASPHLVGTPAGIPMATESGARHHGFAEDKPKESSSALPWILAGVGVVVVAGVVLLIVANAMADAPANYSTVEPPTIH